MCHTKSLATAGRELTVIIVGILIALAADRWMEDQRDGRDEALYLSRIANDLDATIADMGRTIPRFERALEATDILSRSDASSLSPDSIVTLYVAAGHTGVGRAQVGSDVAFRELVSAGRLNLLSDVEFRADVSDFYLDWEDLVGMFTNAEPLPVGIQELTGLYPYRLRGAEAELSDEAKSRVVMAAVERSDAQRDFRSHHAEVDSQLLRLRAMHEAARQLRARLR